MSIFTKLAAPMMGAAIALVTGMATQAQVSGANTFEKLKPGVQQVENPRLVKPGIAGKCRRNNRTSGSVPGVPNAAYGEERPAMVAPQPGGLAPKNGCN